MFPYLHVLIETFLCWVVEFGSLSMSAFSHVRSWVWTEGLWRRRVIYGTLGHSIVWMWANLFPWWRLVTGHITGHISVYIPASLGVARGLYWVKAHFILSADWTLVGISGPVSVIIIFVVILLVRVVTVSSNYLNVVRAVMVWLIWFYGISTIVGYLMPNPIFIYISNI